jgi:hypothetical protein
MNNNLHFNWAELYHILKQESRKVYSQDEWDSHISVVFRNAVYILKRRAQYINGTEITLSLSIAHDLIEDYKEIGENCINGVFDYLLHGSSDTNLARKIFLNDLDYLTRRGGEFYFDYIDRIVSSRNRNILIVKLADLEANISRAKEDSSRLQKYVFAYREIFLALSKIELTEELEKMMEKFKSVTHK